MNCNDALELMLDAEPAELALAVESRLVDHIRGCAKCAAVARRLTGVTQAIAKVVEDEPGLPLAVAAQARVARRRRAAGAGAALAAAAAIALIAIPQGTNVGVNPSAALPVSSSNSTASVAGAPVVPNSVPAKPVGSEVESGTRMPAAEPFRAIAYVASQVAAPSVSEIAVPRNAEPSGGISVAPPAGVRATVMTTSDPTVTVVWLHPADTTRSPR